MSDYNYLISKLQNLSFNRTLNLQVNIFQIMEASSGVVLDRIADLEFLSFAMGRDSSLTINDDNELHLTNDQLLTYLSNRMYYYNPRLLDSIIYDLLNPKVWYDPGDHICISSFDSSGTVTMVNSKGAASSAGNRMLPNASHDYLNYGILLSDNACFPYLRGGDEYIQWDIVSDSTLAPTTVVDPFSFCVAFVPETTAAYWTMFNCNSGAHTSYIRIGAYLDGTTLHVIVKAIQPPNALMTKDITLTVTPGDIQTFNVSYNGSTFSIWVNDESVETSTFTTSSPGTLPDKYMFDDGIEEEAFSGSLLDVIISESELTDGSSEIVRNYFKTKFFL